MNSPAPIDFWFDFSSPYSYIVNEWVDALAARHGRTVRRHAMLLGVTFAAAELKSPVSHPLKREYSLTDFTRSARFEGVPFTSPASFPIATQNAAWFFGGSTIASRRRPQRPGAAPLFAPISTMA